MLHYRHKCLYALADSDMTKQLDYVTSRKEIYLPVYSGLVRSKPQYKNLLRDLRMGQDIIILEVDGPHQESLDYYRKKHGTGPTFIEDGSMLCDPDSLRIMLNDTKHNFGHGYCLAWCLWEDLNNEKIVA